LAKSGLFRLLAGALLYSGASKAAAAQSSSGSVRPPAIESLLTLRQFDAARRAARSLTDARPDDPSTWLLLARSLVAGRTSSTLPRVQAINAVRQSIALDSTNVAAWVLLGQIGMALGGADGESIAQDAWRRVMQRAPMTPGAWENWSVLYRGRRERARMRQLLTPWDSIPAIQLRLAQLLIEDLAYAEADSILDRLVSTGSPDGCVLALRAQSAFEAGDTAKGNTVYIRALARANEAGDCLWKQVVGIATPGELRAWPSLSHAGRQDFLRRFWAVRTPDLFAGTNGRIAEHFRRLRLARERYPLLHPLGAYHRSVEGRAMEAAPSIGEQLFYQRCEARTSPTSPVHAYDRARSVEGDNFGGFAWNPLFNPRSSTHADGTTGGVTATGAQPPGTLYLDPEYVRLVSVPHSRGIRDVDTTAARVGYNLDTGLDDRGIALLRYGEPDRILVSSDNDEDTFCRIPDLERWQYGDVGTVRFFRPNAVFIGLMGGVGQTGDMLFRPMGRGQFEATAEVMTSDASSVPAPLAFGFWTAQFRPTDRSGTDLVVVTTRGAVAAALVGGGDSSATGAAAEGHLVLRSPKGSYTLLVHARDGDSLGRQSAGLQVRAFEGPETSDMLLAPSWSSQAVSREAMLAHLQRDLAFPSGSSIRSYLEIYGLTPGNGRAQYRATYSIYRTAAPGRDVRRDSLPGALTFAFDRQRAISDGVVREWLDIAPERLPRGRYLLRVDIRDPEGRRVGRSQVSFSVGQASP